MLAAVASLPGTNHPHIIVPNGEIMIEWNIKDPFGHKQEEIADHWIDVFFIFP